MMYFKVPGHLDQKTLYKPNCKKRIPNGYFLIANELLTPSECRRINAPSELLTPVNVKKTETYRMFGARFEK